MEDYITREEHEAALARLSRQIEELQAELSNYATRAYVRTYISAYVGESLVPLTVDSQLTGYVPLHIDDVMRHIDQGTISGYRWRQILATYDDYAREAGINPYILVADMLLKSEFGRGAMIDNINTHVESLSTTQFVKDIEDSDKIVRIANTIRGIKYGG